MIRTGAAALLLVLAAAACADTSEQTTTTAPAATTATASSASSPSSPVNPEGTQAALAYVFDGDSLEVEVDGRIEEVRLIGINAPERDECFGDRSRAALIALLSDRDLVLVSGSGGDTDHYGRLLRYVYVEGDNINGRTLADGNAVTLQSEHGFNDAFVEIGDIAASAGYGMWAPNACGAAAPAGATIAEVLSNPPGPDDERLNSEYVTIANEGRAGLDLTGWTLRDESSQNRYVFDDTRIEPGDTVTVRTGCGEDGGNTVFWCADHSVWSNEGDTVILQDSHGNVVDRWMYTGDS